MTKAKKVTKKSPKKVNKKNDNHIINLNAYTELIKILKNEFVLESMIAFDHNEGLEVKLLVDKTNIGMLDVIKIRYSGYELVEFNSQAIAWSEDMGINDAAEVYDKIIVRSWMDA
ncbi:hypothetical protein [Halobacteriovorax sp. DA5]|uniref:hypothetical protein n=1 Tax=Halobacteriovorax sp. DA5 TaxID=2067553 RepID=UPI000CD0C307|nr:hypothetical protein [Halobacteriovorax sp. DA5]POB13858.1 hypothetical protein C0Z22_07300 [Halobacteriovorax sp. DA5]